METPYLSFIFYDKNVEFSNHKRKNKRDGTLIYQKNKKQSFTFKKQFELSLQWCSGT
jgi:hypothetical protein